MIKDWIIFLGSLVILLIIIDGIRRKRNERYGKIRMSPAIRKRQKAEKEDPPSYISELPNGGARVVGHRDPSAQLQSTSSPKRNETLLKANRQPEQTRLNLDEAVPMLMESVPDTGELNQRIEPRFGDERENPDEYDSDEYEDDDLDDRYEEEIEEDYQDDYEADDYEDDDSYEEDDGYEDDDYEEDAFDDEEDEESQENKQGVVRDPEEVFVLHVMAAKDQLFNGTQLLDTVLQCGMRFGELDIFHRHSDAKGQGAPLFSMANMVKPGTFDLDAMDEFTTPGVSFFMTLPIDADSLQTFDLMVDTARAVAGTLQGEIRDDQRSIMTKQTLEHCRERIRDYERQRLFRRPR
jgi:cell division protein ZipA